MTTRICRTCNEEKELDCYYLTNNGKFATECKECVKKRSRRTVLKNPEEVKRKKRIGYIKKLRKAGKLLQEEKLAQPDGTKFCHTCELKLPVENFGKQKIRKDGLNPTCKECRNKKLAIYRKNNKEKIKKQNKKYITNNPHVQNNNTAIRRCLKSSATPSWLTYDQRKESQLFYKLSKQLEKEGDSKYHVDHIIPIRNDKVCGLHVPWNLQVINSTENHIKRNKLLSDNELELCYTKNREQLDYMKES